MQKLKKSWYKKWWGVLLLIILLFFLSLLFASGLYFVNLVNKIRSEGGVAYQISAKKVDEEKLKIIEGEDGYWLGSTDPKVTIVEFGVATSS